MAAIDNSMDKVFQDWDYKRVTLQKRPPNRWSTVGPGSVIGQRLIFSPSAGVRIG